MIYLLFEIIGTMAFAVSGALSGIAKKMDLLGVVTLGVMTAIGGGIIRDIIIGHTPPMAFENPFYAIIAICVSIITFLPIVHDRIDLDYKIWVFFDAIGLAVFTVLGAKRGMELNNSFLAVFLGTITGVGGGVLRDVCSQNIPMIFVKHFYACPCIIGAIICVVLYSYSSVFAMIAGSLIIVILRICAAKYRWHLPKS